MRTSSPSTALRPLLAAAFLALLPFYASAQDAGGGTMKDISSQVASDYEASDKSLNETYQKLMKKLNPDQAQKFKESQRIWLQYRDASAAVFSSVLAQGGSMQKVEYMAAMQKLTEERLGHMEEILDALSER